MLRSLKRSSALAIASLSCVLLATVAESRHVPVAKAAGRCEDGGPCKLGDRGPGGGIVFYVAETPQWWGQYFEAASVGFIAEWTSPLVVVHTSDDAKSQRILGKQLGAGRENTDRLNSLYGDWRLITMVGPNPGARWHVPSKDELDALYNFIATSQSPLSTAHKIGVQGNPYWTSSEASDTFAWYQLFHDGTQFTDANGIVPGLKGNKERLSSSEHKGSSFKPAPMRFTLVRAFASAGAKLPLRPSSPTIPPDGRASATCSAGTSCQVGDIGPGGGVVFYDAGSKQPWGRWLEASPASCQASGKVWRVAAKGKKGTKQLPLLYPEWRTAAIERVLSKRIGMGQVNTALVINQHRGLPKSALEATAAGYANSLVCGGKDDWFLPSKDELDALYNVLALTDNDLTGNNSFGFTRGFYWTSSEYNNETAWTQLWIDGQQFDREKWLTGDPRKDGGFNPFHVRPIRAFG